MNEKKQIALESLKHLRESVERLPPHALHESITHYDYLVLISLILDAIE